MALNGVTSGCILRLGCHCGHQSRVDVRLSYLAGPVMLGLRPVTTIKTMA